MMTDVVPLASAWSLRVTASTLRNIERPLGDNPSSGGGQTYIQIAGPSVAELLDFLGERYPEQGRPIVLSARAIGRPSLEATIEIHEKSAGRLRIANQNRYRAPRHPAWLPENGFPSLDQLRCSTEDARTLVKSIGGLHVFLAFDVAGVLWAGFNCGLFEHEDVDLARILSGENRGGIWRFKGEAE